MKSIFVYPTAIRLLRSAPSVKADVEHDHQQTGALKAPSKQPEA